MTEVNISAVQLLDKLTAALSYELADDEIFSLYYELMLRFERKECGFSNEGNFIYSSMVMVFGDYGTSPRTGWFLDERINNECAIFLKSEISKLGGDYNDNSKTWIRATDHWA